MIASYIEVSYLYQLVRLFKQPFIFTLGNVLGGVFPVVIVVLDYRLERFVRQLRKRSKSETGVKGLGKAV